MVSEEKGEDSDGKHQQLEKKEEKLSVGEMLLRVLR